MSATARFIVFTKPWKMPLPELARFVKGLGLDGVELPVRPGYQVPPENVDRGLPEAARLLADSGLRIGSVTPPAAAFPDERLIAACGQVGVPIIRVCVSIGPEGYLATVRRWQAGFNRILPVLERYHVAIGVQNHCGNYIGSAIGIRHLIEQYDPRYVCAVWDPAHCALSGEPPGWPPTSSGHTSAW